MAEAELTDWGGERNEIWVWDCLADNEGGKTSHDVPLAYSQTILSKDFMTPLFTLPAMEALKVSPSAMCLWGKTLPRRGEQHKHCPGEQGESKCSGLKRVIGRARQGGAVEKSSVKFLRTQQHSLLKDIPWAHQEWAMNSTWNQCQTHTKNKAGDVTPLAQQHFSKQQETSEERTTNHVWKSFPKNLESNMEILLFAGLNNACWMKLFSP